MIFSKRILILFLILLISKIECQGKTSEELWNEMKMNKSITTSNLYFISDQDQIFDEKLIKSYKEEIAYIFEQIWVSIYIIMVKNVCCGDVNNDTFLTEYSNYLFNKIDTEIKGSNTVKGVLILLIDEPKKVKITIGNNINKAIKKKDVEAIYEKIAPSLKISNYYEVIHLICNQVYWNIESYNPDDDDQEEDTGDDESKEEEKKKQEEEKKKQEEERKKQEEEEKKQEEERKKQEEEEKIKQEEERKKQEEEERRQNAEKQKSNNGLLIFIIMILLLSLIGILIYSFKLCKRVKILNSKKIDFNPYLEKF